MSQITPTVLKAVGATPANAELYAPLLDWARHKPGDSFQTITSQAGVAMLVSQLAHESGYFSTLSENLNYSVDALREDNRAAYFTVYQAEALGSVRDHTGRYIRRADQVAIANRYYGGRLGNRGQDTNDGWTFRGAGLIQLTGRGNFEAFGKSVNKSAEEAAEYCRTPAGAVASALWYWRTRGLLIPASRGDVTRCTKLIQGGSAGLQARIALYKRAYVALT